jgi:dTDP-4-dehydrorhamnose 3,5-epimerase
METGIKGLLVIKPHQFSDERGFYNKYFEKDIFKKLGLPSDFSEFSEILSRKGTIRGLHYQNNPSQGKLIHVVTGSLFDVSVDLRRNSETFGKYKYFILRGDQEQAVYIPENFAHGFLALEDNTIFSYQCIGKYVPENCGGIIWNDKELNIPWPLDIIDVPILISEKDKNLQTFDQYKTGQN